MSRFLSTPPAVILLALAAASAARADGPSQKDIDRAIDRGAACLLQKYSGGIPPGSAEFELVALTLLHAGVPPTQPVLAAAIDGMAKATPSTTYRTAIQAMALQWIDAGRHQERIADCAQFLVDNQCQNGQWSYGAPVSLPTRTSSDGKPIEIRQRSMNGGAAGDNSNTQYAILGLAAAARANVRIPREVWQRALNWQQRAQHRDGGWGYGGGDGETNARSTIYAGPSYGSMTCAGIASLALIRKQLGDESGKGPMEGGLRWLSDHFSVKTNPGMEGGHLYYYLYSLERAGVLAGVKTLGAHDWYAEGAAFLIREQQGDGSWSAPAYDTCFAILFLKRATESVHSGSSIVETPPSEEAEK